MRMARLTEEMVVARTRASDLSTIKKLNCWGGELQDISLLRRMTNVEVLSLSVNKISTLIDVQYCKNLRELYVRKNEIKNLNEVCYLKDLPNLKALWLGENPCSASEPTYRLTVIKNLPTLEKLDDVKIEPEERQDAFKKGKDLIHPEDFDDSVAVSPAHSPTRVSRSPPESCRSSDQDHDSNGSRKSYSPDYDQQPTYNDSRHADNMRYPHVNDRYDNRNYQSVRRPSEVSYESSYNEPGLNNGSSVCDKCCNPLSPTRFNTEPYNIADRRDNTSAGIINQSNEEDVCELETGTDNHVKDYNYTNHHQYERPVHLNSSNRNRDRGDSRRGSSSEGSGRLSPQRGHHIDEDGLQQHCDKSYRNSDQQIESSQRYESERHSKPPPYPTRRPVTRNSNLLSAVLCLIKELDYPSLEVVGIAVRCRMDEFDD